MTTLQPLTREITGDTALSQLNLLIDKNALEVTIYNHLSDRPILYRKVELPSSAEEQVKTIENFVYDNPALTGEFLKSNVVFATNLFCILPAEVKDFQLASHTLKQCHPSAEITSDPLSDDLAALGASLVYAPEKNLLNFVRRTFINAPLHHRLSVLANYFSRRQAPGSPARLLVNMREKSFDAVITSSRGLMFANTVEYRHINDAVFYILTLSQGLEDNPVEEILVSGDRNLRNDLIKELRTFHNYVMPMIYPSEMFKAGADALNIPFELVIMPLCE